MSQRAYQVTDWNGTSGERWVSNQFRLDAMLAVFGDAALAAAAPVAGEQVLDIGCGAGATSRALARHVGADGQVIGIDISAALIERARALTPPGAPIRYDLADAARSPLPAASFDLLYSRLGVMFFEQPVPAFTHLRNALKADGRIAFVCWRGAHENDWVRLPMGAIRGIVPAPASPDPEAPGPFAFGNPGRIARILQQAGFADIMIAPYDHMIPFGQGETREAAVDDAVEMAFEVGPLSRALADQPEEIRVRAEAAVRRAFETRPGDRSVMIDGAAWIVTAGRG